MTRIFDILKRCDRFIPFPPSEIRYRCTVQHEAAHVSMGSSFCGYIFRKVALKNRSCFMFACKFHDKIIRRVAVSNGTKSLRKAFCYNFSALKKTENEKKKHSEIDQYLVTK